MQDLLSFIESGYEVSQEVPIYVDRKSLLEYKRLETEISNTADADTLDLLQSQQDAAKARVVESRIIVQMKLPSVEERQEITQVTMSEFGLTGEETYQPRDEFLEEVTTRNIHASIVSITGPNGPEEDLSLGAIRAFRASLVRVPANWNALVDCFNDMVASEVMADLEFKSADF